MSGAQVLRTLPSKQDPPPSTSAPGGRQLMSIDNIPPGATLAAVLGNPPLSDGRTTLKRVHTLARLLQIHTVRTGNLIDVPTLDSIGVSRVGQTREPWVASRNALVSTTEGAEVVLLAWGVSAPGGTAGKHFREQIDWVLHLTSRHGTQVIQVGDGPRHPSRWQRWTSRAWPGVAFEEALLASLTRVSPPVSDVTGTMVCR